MYSAHIHSSFASHTSSAVQKQTLYILQVHSLRGQGGMPSMEHIYCIPLLNVQQIVLGYKVPTDFANLCDLPLKLFFF